MPQSMGTNGACTRTKDTFNDRADFTSAGRFLTQRPKFFSMLSRLLNTGHDATQDVVPHISIGRRADSELTLPADTWPYQK
jgi:hypothetical protein